jgi:uncharacterized membrane protein
MGWSGKPSHPPLTDASIGAYTVGVAMLVAGALGVEEEQMAHGSLLAIGGGLALALPTALTGLLDWLELPKGTSARTTATVHLVTMVTATLLFALAFVAQLDGYDNGRVESLGLAVGLAVEGVLTLGGYLGGTIVFVLVPVNTEDNVLHLLIGIAGLTAGAASPAARPGVERTV